MTRKISCVITARPSYARIKTALLSIDNNDSLELDLIVTSSALLDRYGEAIKVMENDGFKPKNIIYNVLEGENLITSAKTTAIAIMELATVFANLKPDVVISIADRYETMATAIAASYMNIPIVHIQGGEVTGSIDEKVRHAVTKLSDFHFVANQDAYDRVIKLGEIPKRVFITGCPSIDLAIQATDDSESLDPACFKQGVGYDIHINEDYLVVMQHSVTYEWKESSVAVKETLEAISSLNIPTFWFWPNVDAGSDLTSRELRKFRENNPKNKIRFVKNLSPEHFLSLINNSLCLVGNSSAGIREASAMGLPVVNIGSRQSGRLRSENVLDVDYDSQEIIKSIEKQIAVGAFKKSNIYGDGFAGEKISDLLAEIELFTEKKITY